MAEGLRERKKNETRRALASAALRLADRLGPDRVTVEEIAEAAGVSPRTFFNYFATKDDAIVGVIPAGSTTLVQGLVDRPADEPPLVALRASVQGMAAFFMTSADEWEVRQRLLDRHPELAARHAARFADMERVMADEIARRTGRSPGVDPYPTLVVGAALAAARASLAAWQARGRRDPIDRLVDEAFDHLAAGLAAEARPPGAGPTEPALAGAAAATPATPAG
jgi:AcrR family transcriptional regulator